MPIRTPDKSDRRTSYTLAGSRLEDIDTAIFNHINDKYNIHVNTNKGFEKVPVKYALPERAYQIKNDPKLRTENGRTLVYPLISIRRGSLNINPANKARYGVDIPPYFDYYKKGGSIRIATVIEQGKTKNFTNADSIRSSFSKKDKNLQTGPRENEKVVYSALYVPMPTFVEITYEVSLISEYQQQMNELVAPFMAKVGVPPVFRIENEGNKYECFVDQSFSLEDNSTGLGTEERIFKTNISMKVLGYIIGSDKNQDTPVIIQRQGAARATIKRERVVLGDEIEAHFPLKEKYRP